MPKQKNIDRLFYLNEKLKNRMSYLSVYPCTVVEAPIGYGKTTAVTEVLETTDVRVIWQKIYERNASEFWTGFCNSISKIDEECGKGFNNIAMLEDHLLRRELLLLLDKIKVPTTTFLVIDDYHYVKSEAVDDFLNLLISILPKNLHLIVITRVAFLPNTKELELKGIVNYIGVKEFSLTMEDIQSYYRLLGINLSREEQKQLYEYSEGWISALYLCALDYKMHGGLLLTRSVPELVYQTVYEPMNEEHKQFMMSISQFNAFSVKQAEYVWQKGNASELLEQLLSLNAFLTKDSITGNYSIHNILGMCVTEQFELLSEDRKQSIWKRTGEMYDEARQYMAAMDCYYHAGYYEGIMSTMNSGEKAISHTNQHKDLIIRCYQDCPYEVKMNHPLSILMFGMLFVTQFREPQLFMEICQDFQRCMAENKTLSKDERSQLLGEYEVLQTFTVYNDIIKMGEINLHAATLLNQPARFINTKNSFLFGAPSALYHYYRESGKLDDIIRFIKQSSVAYAKNSKGHGNGYRPLLEAEWQYQTGDINNAEITVYNAISMSHESGDADVELSGIYLLAKISLYRGDYAGLMEHLTKMETITRYEISQYHTYWLVYLMDLCKAYLNTCLNRSSELPEWIFEFEYPKHMHFLSIGYANLVYGKALLLKGENSKLLGLSEAFHRQVGMFPNLYGVVSTYLYTSIASYRLECLEESKDALIKALDIAAPDRLIMPFVENGQQLLPIFDLLKDDIKFMPFIKRMKEVYETYHQSVNKIINENFTDNLPKLTAREKQIALLVLEDMNNRKIAEVLNISTDTVKAELKNIFKKRNINSRVLLKKEMIV